MVQLAAHTAKQCAITSAIPNANPSAEFSTQILNANSQCSFLNASPQRTDDAHLFCSRTGISRTGTEDAAQKKIVYGIVDMNKKCLHTQCTYSLNTNSIQTQFKLSSTTPANTSLHY
jgi:hypothetical protein